MEKKSNILEFFTDKNRYIYDGVSGEIVPSGKWTKYIIENFYILDKDMMVQEKNIRGTELSQFMAEYLLIGKLVDEGMFYIEKKDRKNVNMEKYIFQANSSQLILVLTGKCNMRCEYCVYCEKYPKEIGYTDEDMNFEIAKKAIDLYFKIHREKVEHGYKKQPMINFYGGEPLVRFDLIQQIVEYIENIDKSSRFYITTNGLLINEHVANFISDHKFTVTFSLDGFKENHDRNRVTTGGKPTFDILLNNIKILQQIKRRKKIIQPISFNCCFDNYTDLEKCIKFFEDNYNEFFPFFTMYNQINPFDTSYYTWTKERVINGEIELDENAFNNSYKAIRERVFNGKDKGKEKELSMNLFTSSLMLYLRNKWNDVEFNNSCIPLSKIAVYPDGEICLCEKMNKKLSIGNVTSGIDRSKLNEYTKLLIDNFISGKCSECIAKKVCPACFMYLNSEGQFNNDFCQKQKDTLSGRLAELYHILENNPKFIESLKVSGEFVDVLEVNN